MKGFDCNEAFNVRALENRFHDISYGTVSQVDSNMHFLRMFGFIS